MADTKEILIFKELRKQVVAVFQKTHHVATEVENWSGQDIATFQENLLEKVQTTISEKWFYTYFKKNEVNKLPRIDMLNLLSQYVGVENWLAFSQANEKVESNSFFSLKNRILGISAGMLLLVLMLVYLFYPKVQEYHFCFVDQDVQLPITSSLQIMVLQENQSPLYFQSAENGCFSYKTRDKEIQFVVESPYYKSDTIIRSTQNYQTNENIQLAADEYALILHYFSTNNVEDWNSRREQLGKMINDQAVIYQVFGSQEFGMDVLSKQAFINKITLPTSSLRNMRIIEIERKDNQITKLKFETILSYE